jgi:hypothetical protein
MHHQLLLILALLLLLITQASGDGCPQIISRAEWGARPPANSPTILGDNVNKKLV